MSRARALLAGLREMTESDRARALVALAAVLQVMLTLPLFDYPSEPAGDDMTIHMAEVAAIARSLAAGELDLWNPSANAGFASAYYYQFLPQLGCALLYLALGWLVSLATLFKLTCVAALVAVPLTGYRALTVLGLRPLAAASGALAASFVYADSGWGAGIDSLFVSGLYTQAFAMALYPLAAAYAARYLLAGEHLGRAVAYTALCGFCHPFVAFAVAPALLCAPWWRIAPAQLARRSAVLLGSVLACSAPLWLPILVHYHGFGGFPERVAGEHGIGARTFVPDLARGRYLDAGRLPVLTALALAAPLLALTGRRQGRVVAALAAAGFLYAALIVAGPLLPKTRGDLIPAVRFLGPMQLCLAAAAGAAVAVGAPPAVRRARASLVIAGCAVLLGAVVAGGFARSTARVKTIDHFEGYDRDELGQVIAYLADQPRGRVYADGALGTGSHWWMYLPYVLADRPALRAYGGAALQSSPNFAALRQSFALARHWRHFGVRYVLVSKNYQIGDRLTGAAPTFETDDYEVWTYPAQTLWSPVSIEKRAERDRQSAVGIAWMKSVSAGDPGVVVFGPTPGDRMASPDRARIGEVRDQRASHRAVIEISGERPALVRLAVSHHRGWSATIDGQPTDIIEVSPALMAVAVPPGRHVVRFEFSRPRWTWLLWGALAIVGIAALWRRRRLATAAALVLLAGSAEVRAQPDHAPVDAAFAADGSAVISTSAGLWIRPDAGAQFEYLCPGSSGTEAGAFEPRVAAGAGRVLVAGYRGLWAGEGCGDLAPMALLSPESAPETAAWIESVEIGGDGQIWAASADATGANDVYRGRGGHLESAGLRSQVRWYLSALPSPADPAVVYVSGYQVAPPGAAIEVSVGGKGGFAPAAAEGLRLGRSHRSRFVAGDPDDPDVAYLAAESVIEPRGDVLYRTRDRGARFEPVASPGAPITAVVARPEAIWVAVAGPCKPGGAPGCLLRVAGDTTAAIAGPPLSCLAIDGRDRLVGCRADAMSSQLMLVTIGDDGAQRPLVEAGDLAPPCAAVADRCEDDWSRACRALGADCDAAPRAEPDAPAAEGLRRPVLLLLAVLGALAPLPWLLLRRRRANRE